MTQAESHTAAPSSTGLSRVAMHAAVILVGLGALAVFTAVGIKGLSSQRWVFVLAAIAAPLVMYGIVRRPQIATSLTVFLLYANLPVVAMKFHGIPFTVAAAVPLLLLLPIAYNVCIRKETIRLPATVIPIIIFFVIQTLSTMFSPYPDVAMKVLYRSLIEGMVVVVLVVNAINDRAGLQNAVWALALGGALMGAVCTHQYVTKSYDSHYGGLAQLEAPRHGEPAYVPDSGFRRAAGTVGVKNRFAQNMLMLLPICFCSILGMRAPRLKLLLGLLTFLTFLGWALAFSRGSAIGLALVCMIAASLGLLRWRHLGVVAIVAGILLLSLPAYRERLASLATLTRVVDGKQAFAQSTDGSIRGRFTEMLAAGRVAADYPVVGVGPGVFPYLARQYAQPGAMRALETKRQAHNLYLSVAAEHGIPGLICLVLMVGMTIGHLLQLRRTVQHVSPPLAYLLSGFALALTAYMATGMFGHFSFVRFFWLMMALANAAICVAHRELKHHPTHEPHHDASGGPANAS